MIAAPVFHRNERSKLTVVKNAKEEKLQKEENNNNVIC
jgi:hypothetical protein